MMADVTHPRKDDDVSATLTGVVFSPEEQERLNRLNDAIASIVQAAQSIEVRNENEANWAVEFLSNVAREKKAAENARHVVVDPLTAHVKFLNEHFKRAVIPLEKADAIVRPKVVAYQQELDRKRLEAEARLRAEEDRLRVEAEEEKRRDEDKARKQREEASRAAALAEAEAQASERAREESASAIEHEMTELSSITLTSIIDNDSTSPRAQAAEAVMARRREHRAAEARALGARESAEKAELHEREAHGRPPVEVPRMEAAVAAPMRGLSGAASMRSRWKGTVEDPEKVPRKYMIVDQKGIDADVRAGVREIPGVRIEQVKGLQVRAK